MKQNWAKGLAFFAVIAAFIVIALGAFTRLADAGLGCPDWPTCYGHVLWPQTDEQVSHANNRFDETPVEMDKTWPEQVHRLFASSLGLISLILFTLAFLRSEKTTTRYVLLGIAISFVAALVAKISIKVGWDYGAEAIYNHTDAVIGLIVLGLFALIVIFAKQQGSTDSALKLSTFLVGFVILQGLFGMWTVTLKVWPQVVTLHLLGGFTVVSLFWLLFLRLQQKPWQVQHDNIKPLLPFAKLCLLVVFIQIALGGWTTSNYAAVACPDLPTCQHQWWPAMDFVKGFNLTQEIGPNYLGGTMDNDSRVAIHMSHRIGAIIVVIALLSFLFSLWRTQQTAVKTLAVVTASVLTLQVLLGLSNILFNFPLSVAVLHNGVGALLLLCMVTMVYRISTIQSGTNHD